MLSWHDGKIFHISSFLHSFLLIFIKLTFLCFKSRTNIGTSTTDCKKQHSANLMWEKRPVRPNLLIHFCTSLPLPGVLFRTEEAPLFHFYDCLRVLVGKRLFLSAHTIASMLGDIKKLQNSASVEFHLCGQGGISLFWNWGVQYCLQGWQTSQLSFAKCSTDTDESHERCSGGTFVS